MLPPLKDVIHAHGLLTRKSLGQHFLLDANICARIADAARIGAGDTVIEIGPGPGGLTRALLKTPAARVIAVEKDARCIAALEELKAVYGERLSVIEADALECDAESLCAAPRRIVSNLPYNVGTPLLIGWLKTVARDGGAFASMTLMFQKEVALRIAAQPNSKEYGRLSVLAQTLCDVHRHFDLPPGAFHPPPKVESSVITLTPLPAPRFPVDVKVLERVLAAGFNQRRKMLRASLKSLGADTEALLAQASIDGTRRAETLSVEEWCRLAQKAAKPSE